MQRHPYAFRLAQFILAKVLSLSAAACCRIPIPGFTEYGVGDYECHPTLELLKTLEFKSGVVTTGNAFDHTEMDDRMMDENGALEGG